MTKEEFNQLPVAKKIEACDNGGEYYQLYISEKMELPSFLSLPPEPVGPYFPMPAHVYRIADFYVIEHNGIHGRRFYTSQIDPFEILRKDSSVKFNQKSKKKTRTVIAIAITLYIVIPLIFAFIGMRQHVPSVNAYVFISLQYLATLFGVLMGFVIKWAYVGFFFLLIGFPVILLYTYIKEDILGISKID